MKQVLFSQIVTNYRAVFFDSYGVLRNHRGLIPGAGACIDALRERGVPFRVLTNNAARSPQRAADRMDHYGLAGILAEQIITSGSTTQAFLTRKVKSGKVAYLGTEAAAEYIFSSGLQPIAIADVDMDNLSEIAALAFLDDEGYNLNVDLNKVVNILRQCQVPVVVANTDLLYPVTAGEVAVATGSIAKLVEYVLGRRFVKFGKPASQMFQLAFDQLTHELPNLDPAEILMVGDTLHTDILGGNTFGLDTALVLSGNTQAKKVEEEIASSGIIPDFICQSIGK